MHTHTNPHTHTHTHTLTHTHTETRKKNITMRYQMNITNCFFVDVDDVIDGNAEKVEVAAEVDVKVVGDLS